MPSGVGLGMRRVITLLLLALGLSLAQAQTCTQTLYRTNGKSATDAATAQASCAAYGPVWVAAQMTPSEWAVSSAVGTFSGTSGQCDLTVFRNGSFTTHDYSLIGTVQAPCANPCLDKQGQTKTVNLTEAWARSNTPNANDIAVEVPTPWEGNHEMCDGQCLVDLQSVDACWRSQVPGANGLHRISCDYTARYSATQCTAKADPSDPGAPTPPCPGFTGSVNGKPVCVGTPSTPLPTLPKNPVGAPPEGTGNPAAGDKPTEGTGSGSDGAGRTPTVGSGGNAGGGSNASIPGGGSEGNGQGDGTPVGTGPDGSSGGVAAPGDPVEVCGLPGKAACKIDEAGTPDGSGAYNGAKAGFDAATANEVAGINGSGSHVTTLPWLFTFGMPTGSCSALSFDIKGRTFTIDPCNSPVVALWRSVAAWLLYVMAALYIWRSATSSNPGGK